MKTIRVSKRLTVRVPTTRVDWMCLFLLLGALYQTIARKPAEAIDLLQLAMLLEIIGRLPEDNA